MTSSDVDVLIIGAGPTGLMLGCQLALHPHVKFRIIDKNAAATTQSRALGVHARSLELLAQLDIVEKAISEGEIADAMKVFFYGKCRFKLDVSHIRSKQQPLLTRYPYLLLLEQAKTEEILETFLNEHNVHVERNSEAVDLIDSDSIDGSGVQVTLSTGEVIRAKYVGGCDGAKSIVRHKLNLQFSGRTYSESLFVADCQIDNAPLSLKEAGVFFEATGMGGLFPMANGRYRIVATVHDDMRADTQMDFKDAIAIIKQRTQHFNMNPHDCSWISVYRSHHRCISTFRCRKRYFLLGDAAHIHSPVGGQGMNTGLQDAHNLGWKLSYVLKGVANDRLLDTYHDERSTVAKAVVNTTDRIFAFTSSTYWFTRLIRLYIAPYILRFIVQPIIDSSRTIRQAIFHRLSQLAVSYRSSNVYDYGASAGKFQRITPLPGDRFPYVIFDPRYYHLVIFENQQSSKLTLFVELIKQKYSDMIKIHDIHEENIPFRYDGVIVIRPDGFVAYRTTLYDIDHFENYLGQFFIKQ